jgi:MFS family permease
MSAAGHPTADAQRGPLRRTSERILGRRGGFAAAAYAFAVTMLGTTLPTPLYPIYRQELGLSQLMVTVIFAAYAAGVIAALLLFGRLSDQIGRRRALLPGLALSALSAVAFLLADGTVLLLAGRVLSGLSAGIFTGTATATLADLAPHHTRGRATLIATAASIGGLGLGPLLAGLLAELAGSPLRLTYWVDLALLVPAAALVWAMPEPALATGSARLRPQTLQVPAQLRATFARAALTVFAGFSVLGLFTAVSPALLDQLLGFESHATAGLVVFAVFAASLAGQLTLERVPGSAALPAGCLALSAAMGLLALAVAVSSLALLITSGVVAGLGQGLSFRAGLAAINRRTPPDRRGAVASSFFAVAYVAISLPVIGLGVTAELAGLQAAGLIFAAGIGALALTVLALLSPRFRWPAHLACAATARPGEATGS